MKTTQTRSLSSLLKTAITFLSFQGKKPILYVATHDGVFHSDEVAAVAMIYIVFSHNYDIRVIRTRDFNSIPQGAFFIDIGKEYNPAEKRFDHHQKDGAGKRDSGVPYASFGLILKYFRDWGTISEAVYQHLDARLGQPIDAIDNFGPNYFFGRDKSVRPYNIREIIQSFFPDPTEEDTDGVMDEAFMNAVRFVTGVLKREIANTERMIVQQALVEKAYIDAPNKEVILLTEKLPWHSILASHPEPKFVVCPYAPSRFAVWAVQREGKFIPLPPKGSILYNNFEDRIVHSDEKRGHLIIFNDKKAAEVFAISVPVPQS